jgi:formate dehydrogenase subunit delta
VKIEYLVKMANEIDAFFGTGADPAERVAAVANHLQRFWDPRMRAQIIAHEAAGGAGLKDHVRQAVAQLARGAKAS